MEHQKINREKRSGTTNTSRISKRKLICISLTPVCE
jgi:hypothetical protein